MRSQAVWQDLSGAVTSSDCVDRVVCCAPVCSRAAFVVTVVWVLVVGPAGQAQDPAPETLAAEVGAFWAATSDAQRADAAGAIAARGASFEEVAAAFRARRPYPREAATGRRVLTRRNPDGLEHPYIVHIPDAYDPSDSYPVRVYLHGGVMRPLRDDGAWWRNQDPYPRSDSIVVFPASWPGSLWWQESQIENLHGLLNDIKRVYNVDENRVYLLGMSDGATGAFYHAFKATTPWAAFLPFHGHAGVLANPSADVDGQMHVTNLLNKPLLIVNGGRDRLYPLEAVGPFIQLFESACQGRSKIRPPWRRKTRPLGSWVEWRNAAVRRGRQDAGVAAGWRAFLLCSRR